MKDITFSTHWSPEQAISMLDYLCQLQETIRQHYAKDIEGFFQEMTESLQNPMEEVFDFDDNIPF